METVLLYSHARSPVWLKQIELGSNLTYYFKHMNPMIIDGNNSIKVK